MNHPVEKGSPRYPSLYQINTRVWLTELGRKLNRPATLDDIADADLDHLAALGFDWLWFLSVWQTGPAGRQVSRTTAAWRKEFQETLPDLREEDIIGSGFAIARYSVDAALGGDAALVRLRARLKKRGLKLLLDFVPNHSALDHPWAYSHPDYYLRGSEQNLAQSPGNFTRIKTNQGSMILAHGRDPYFPGWPDTLQLNYANPALQEAMIGELVKVAGQCDGVRCDMAMLVLPEVFEKTWGLRAPPFWSRAIRQVRVRHADFCFLAEVYWDMEWALQQQGFDYAYDKRLYDRLRQGQARPVRLHFQAGLDYQSKLARFLENHDEERAAATFAPGMHEAAAVITYFSPGLRFFHQGQLQGRKQRISPHLGRAPLEPADADLESFYHRLLAGLRLPALRTGTWQLVHCAPAWDGNWTFDCFIACAWQSPSTRLIVAVNYAPHQSQCLLKLPFTDLANRPWRLEDQLSSSRYDRAGNDLAGHGLYLDLLPWQAHLFTLNQRG